MTLDPAVAAVRLAVRRSLGDVGAEPVLVACSGGADSLALLAATLFEGRRRPRRIVGVTVDHGLQEGSADRAARLVARMTALGAAEAVAVRVEVVPDGRGLEAAARQARYAALTEAARRASSPVVLLGHTLDDQAETVLLGLTRGSGGRSLAGMRPDVGVFRRPLLRLTRDQTEAACVAEALEVWHDPHNEDPRFTRSRVRHRVMPLLEAELGPGVAAALARTADALQEDLAALDGLAVTLAAELGLPGPLDVARLRPVAAALRRRLLRSAALEAGAAPGELTRGHVLALDDLLWGPRGRQVPLPGHVSAYREDDRLVFRRTGETSPGPAVGG